MPGKLLFKLAKNPLMGKVVGLAFQYCAGIIPVQKVYKSKAVLAFFHPQPSYPDHMILSPRKPVRNLQQMSSAHLAGVWEAVRHIQKARFSCCDSFVLIVNGGWKQEVQQVHFHLFTNNKIVDDDAPKAEDVLLYQEETLCVLERPAAEGRLHFVLKPQNGQANQTVCFSSVLQTIDRLDAKFHIVENGYSLIYQHGHEKCDMDHPVFHILSGKRKT